jgi:hypothetical protein
VLEETKMMHDVSKAALGLVLALVLGGTASAAGWVQHNAPDKGFSAVFPKAPKVEDSTQDGVKMTSFAPAAGALCIAAAVDYPYVVNPTLKPSRAGTISPRALQQR